MRTFLAAITVCAGAAILCAAPEAGRTREPASGGTDLVSPLPPPATRSALRGRWFEFLSALNDDDVPSARIALSDLLETADRVGISRLSDFSRAALQQARRARESGDPTNEVLALGAAIRLDPELFDARWEKLRYDLRRRDYAAASTDFGTAMSALLTAYETRREIVSNAVIVATAGLAGAAAGFILILVVRHMRRILHDLAEFSGRLLGGRKGAVPLVILLLGLPLWLTLGPFWLFLYWGGLAFLYAERAEQRILAVLLVAVGGISPCWRLIADKNLIARSPLVAATADLAEMKEEGASVELLHQASRVFPEDPTVWYLLGRFAQRRLAYDEAATDYARSLRNDPRSFRTKVALGNIHFWQGDLMQAVQDYREAVQLHPGSALAYYNLSLAQGDAYLFDQQRASLSAARQISPREVDHWIESPTLARVLSRGFTVGEAERRSREWSREAKSQLLPGMVHRPSWPELFWAPEVLAPWAALLLAILIDAVRSRRGVGAMECVRCGRSYCRRCKPPRTPPTLCADCSATLARRDVVDPDVQSLLSEQARKKQRLRRRERRLASLVLPGARGVAQGMPVRGFFTLLAFCVLLAAALLTHSLFPVYSLPGGGVYPVRQVAAASLAFLIWIVAGIRTMRA
jgi:tetratricopeptide (TPR) repeat protein